MLPREAGGFSEVVIGPVRNGWLADDSRSETIVLAGGQGYSDPNKGGFFIVRNGASPHNHGIPVDRAGTIKITKAPLGCSAATWAQKRGNLEFTSTNGVSGTFHLEDDTVTLNP